MQTSFLCLALFAGALLPIQASINAKLLDPLNNAIAPAFVSFVGGSIMLSVFFFAKVEENNGATAITYDKPSAIFNSKTWSLLKTAPTYLIILPGLFGAIYGVLAAFVGDQIGSTLFFAAVIAGQIVSSIIADAIGFLGLEKKPATPLRTTSMILVFSGALLSVSDNLRSNVDESSIPTAELIVYILLSLFSSVVLGLQPPMNAKLQRHMGSHAHRITWWCFVNGALSVLVFTAISVPVTNEAIGFENVEDIEVWKFMGGPLGALFVYSSIFLAPRMGLGGFVVAAVAGQLISSLLVDSLGLLESDKVALSATRIIGVIIVYVAVILFRLEEQILALFKTPIESVIDKQPPEVKPQPVSLP